jgi:hypothetical protein
METNNNSKTAEANLQKVNSGDVSNDAADNVKPKRKERRYTDKVYVYHRFDHEPFYHQSSGKKPKTKR